MKGYRRRPNKGMPFRGSPGPGKVSGAGAIIRTLLWLVAIACVVGGALVYSVARRGLSAHDEPSWPERTLAGAMRRLAVPRALRTQQNPLEPTEAVLEEALAHYADDCAVCHANDGSGNTAMGRGLYPRVPDMRAAATQSLSDGELFSIIEHGIRLTGMPAWGTGTPESERQSWSLVHFIRRLPTLSPDDLTRLEELSPRTPAELREREAIRRFLEGDPGDSPAVPPSQRQED
jgi:mono/diheme cytochrome c family protein